MIYQASESDVLIYVNGRWITPILYARVNGIWVPLFYHAPIVIVSSTYDNFNLDVDVTLIASIMESTQEQK